MIRPAKFVDVPRIVELLCEMQMGSKYAGIVEVDERAAHQLVAQAVQRHGGTHYGGTLVMVTEGETIEGFIIGMLDRVYHVGSKLSAQDAFLYCTDKAESRAFMKLLNAYKDWAMGNPRVHELKMSWTDTLPGAERMGAIYRHMGFRRCGEIYERVVEHDDVVMVAA